MTLREAAQAVLNTRDCYGRAHIPSPLIVAIDHLRHALAQPDDYNLRLSAAHQAGIAVGRGEALDEDRLARLIYWGFEWYASPREMAAAIAKAYREDE